MKKAIIATVISLSLTFTLSALSLASSSHGSSHKTAVHETDGQKSHDMAASGAMDHSMHKGNKIHSSMVGEYHFNYELIDMREKLKGMKNIPAMKATHHMMLSIKSHQGHMLEKAKVGFFVKNPDGTSQKLMAMAMGGGFGADADFKAKGIYTIKVKAIAGDEKLLDTFEYEIK